MHLNFISNKLRKEFKVKSDRDKLFYYKDD